MLIMAASLCSTNMESASALPMYDCSTTLLSEPSYGQTSFPKDPLFTQVSCTFVKPCQLSREQWEGLKAPIRQVYVEENRTLKQLIVFIRDEHGFLLSTKQLTKRLDEWGFWKHDRKRKSEELHSDIQCPQVKNPPKKTPGGRSTSFGEDTKIRSISTIASISLARAKSHVIDAATLDCGNPAQIPHTLKELKGNEVRHLGSPILEPLLSRLFTATRIQPDGNASRIHFTFPDLHTTTESQYLSRTEIMKLTMGDEINDSDLIRLKQSPPWSLKNRFFQLKDSSSRTSALKSSNTDILFPSEIEVVPDPFMELSPFPNSLVERNLPGSTFQPRFTTYMSEVAEYNDKFTRLGRLCQETHPTMINIMGKLGSAYYGLGNAKQSEHWYRRTVAAIQQTENSVSLRLLYAWLGVIDAISTQGRFVEAKKLHLEIHQSILKIVAPDHPIVQKSLLIIALILDSLGHHKSAEEHCRQLLQIRLNTFGLRHRKTITALQRLACPIRRQERYHDFEELCSIVRELRDATPGFPDYKMSRSLNSLARARFQQRQYSESERLHREAAEKLRFPLGEEHPATMRCVYHLARTLRLQSRLKDCEKLIRATLERQMKVLGESAPDTIDSMVELRGVLEITGRDAEANAIYETLRNHPSP